MHSESVVDRVTQELLAAHDVHTIFLYGSHADGSAGPDSDYDIAAFGPVAEPSRIARLDAGGYLDVFIYPDALLLKPGEAFLKLRGGKILMQRDALADDLLRRLDEIFRRGPLPLGADEIAARKVWARKMVTRIGRADPEGNYRRAWLLQALLEDYFHIRGRWYEGPKKSLRWLAQVEPAAYETFCAALEPGASDASIAALVDLVVGSSTT